jgi:hypothetical protein
MKKIVCLVVVVLMMAAVAIAAKKMKIAEKDLPGLKGTWVGILSFGEMEAVPCPAQLEILNDTVPVKARLTVEKFPHQLASHWGIEAPGGKAVAESDDGVITTQGTLMWTGPAKNFFEVTLLDNKKLSLWYFFRGVKGDATLKKK